MTDEPIMTVERVSKFYGRKVMGLNDISVNYSGGISGLLGPNGAGKSTMMKIMTGQIKPSIGRVHAFGLPVWDNPKLNKRIGFCPEQDAFYPNMTGLDFVKMNAKLAGVGGRTAEKMAKKAIRTVDLTKAMNRNVTGYSKGMRQRIKIAQALVHDPELLVLDEPLAGTDPLGRIKIIELMFEQAKEGKHIIVSSHVLHEVERMTQKIVLINKGKLVAQGDISDIRDSMDKFPLNVRIRTPDPRGLARHLTDLTEVTSLSFKKEEPDMIMVMTSDPSAFYDHFQELVIGNRIRISSIDSPDDSLDAIFRYLVG